MERIYTMKLFREVSSQDVASVCWNATRTVDKVISPG